MLRSLCIDSPAYAPWRPPPAAEASAGTVAGPGPVPVQDGSLPLAGRQFLRRSTLDAVAPVA